MENYDVQNQAVKETKKLQVARRGLTKLQEDEDKFLANREKKAQARLETVHTHIEGANSLLASITKKIVKKINDYRERFETFASGLSSALAKTDEILDRADDLQATSQKLFDVITGKYEELQEMEGELGKFDKELVKREKEVEEKNKKADKKLEEAENLAYWHKSGQRYSTKKKK